MLLLFWILADLVLLARPRCTQHTGPHSEAEIFLTIFDVFFFRYARIFLRHDCTCFINYGKALPVGSLIAASSS